MRFKKGTLKALAIMRNLSLVYKLLIGNFADSYITGGRYAQRI
jgi:hypothetical protein